MSVTTTGRAVARRATIRRSAALLLGAALVTLTATACNSTGSSVSTEAKQPAATSGAAAGAATGGTAAQPSGAAKPADSGAAKAPAKVGDTIALKSTLEKNNTADVTVVKVVDPAESANEYLQPEAGKRYVSVQFQIKVTGSATYNEAPWSGAKVVDSQGQSFGPSLADTKAGPAFQTPTTIAPGETGKGFITFEVPKDVKLDKIQFALDNGFADQVGQWKIA
ncbi:DUF4352 domain-containing protein [Kitasatospora sp. NPDC004240]